MDPRYDPRSYAPPPYAYSAAPRRGGYLGPNAETGAIQDYSRNHLRPPPRGYMWVRTARGMALISQSTHQVFDVVPY
jgi:Ni/Co efflux regulator RcnB